MHSYSNNRETLHSSLIHLRIAPSELAIDQPLQPKSISSDSVALSRIKTSFKIEGGFVFRMPDFLGR